MLLVRRAAVDLARARVAVSRHPDYSDSGYLQAVDAAFNNWEAMQKAGR